MGEMKKISEEALESMEKLEKLGLVDIIDAEEGKVALTKTGFLLMVLMVRQMGDKQ